MEWKKKAEYQDLAALIKLIKPYLSVRNVVGAVWMLIDVVVIVLLIVRGTSWLGW